MPSTTSALSLPFDEAIAYLAQKTNATSEHWTDVWQKANAKSFTVAGAATDALVADFRAEVAKALERGTTLAEFRKGFDAIVTKHGWQHTGTPGWRSRIIYETNLSMAYSAGRWVQQTEPETLAQYPYWTYRHSGSLHPRLNHLAWDGITLLATDPWWSTHYAPNGWHCGCYVSSTSARGLARMGKSGPDQAPPIVTKPWVNPHTGEVHQVPVGIDPSFDYNPGQAWQATPVAIPANATFTVPPLPVKKPKKPPAFPVKPKPSPAPAAPAALPTLPKPLPAVPPPPPVPTAIVPPTTAHGGDFATAIGFAGKFVDTFKFSSKLIGGGKPPTGASPAVKAAFDTVEGWFGTWKKTGKLPTPAEIDALVESLHPPLPGARDPALGHVKAGATKVMEAPRTTAVWKPVSAAEAEAEQLRQIKAANLGPAERDAQDRYKGSLYDSWNAALRKAGGDVTKVPGTLKTLTERLDAAIERHRLPTDLMLHRGARYDSAFPSVDAALAAKGETYVNPAYFSTSTQLRVAEHFAWEAAKPPAPRVVFTIRVKAGSPALVGTDYESEYIFPRGKDWRILDVEQVADDTVHVLLEPL